MKKKEEKEIFERSWKKKCIKAKAVDQILPLLRYYQFSLWLLLNLNSTDPVPKSQLVSTKLSLSLKLYVETKQTRTNKEDPLPLIAQCIAHSVIGLIH